MSRHVVALVSEIPPGKKKIVEVAGREIGVFNVRGTFYALRNRCPHQGGPLCEGRLAGSLRAESPGSYEYDETLSIIRCPWHLWEFDLRTGRSWCEPERLRVRTYRTYVEEAGGPERAGDGTGDGAGEGAVGPRREAGPFTAETYAVWVDQDRVVVDLSSRAA